MNFVKNFTKCLPSFYAKSFMSLAFLKVIPFGDAWVDFVWEFQTKPADELSMNV